MMSQTRSMLSFLLMSEVHGTELGIKRAVVKSFPNMVGTEPVGGQLVLLLTRSEMMGLAAYEIIGNDAEWRVRHDGKADNTYETKEAAFEAAVAAASLALRQGHEIRVTAPARGLASGSTTGIP
jgi:hypothetical protein